MYLDYDTYNVDGSLSAQVGLLMPNVPTSFEVRNKEFKKDLFTVFNRIQENLTHDITNYNKDIKLNKELEGADLL